MYFIFYLRNIASCKLCNSDLAGASCDLILTAIMWQHNGKLTCCLPCLDIDGYLEVICFGIVS